jgi:hypothetical protein
MKKNECFLRNAKAEQKQVKMTMHTSPWMISACELTHRWVEAAEVRDSRN